MRWLALVLLFLLGALPAAAQTVADPGVSIVFPRPGPISVTGNNCDGELCTNYRVTIPLSYFGTSAEIASLRADFDRSAELAVLAAAIKDAIPNEGDRFAVSFNVAGDGQKLAGALGLGLRLGDKALLNFNYARGATQGIASGGVTLSFP